MFLLKAVDSYEGLYNLLSGCGAEAGQTGKLEFQENNSRRTNVVSALSCEIHSRRELDRQLEEVAMEELLAHPM